MQYFAGGCCPSHVLLSATSVSLIAGGIPPFNLSIETARHRGKTHATARNDCNKSISFQFSDRAEEDPAEL